MRDPSVRDGSWPVAWKLSRHLLGFYQVSTKCILIYLCRVNERKKINEQSVRVVFYVRQASLATNIFLSLDPEMKWPRPWQPDVWVDPGHRGWHGNKDVIEVNPVRLGLGYFWAWEVRLSLPTEPRAMRMSTWTGHDMGNFYLRTSHIERTLGSIAFLYSLGDP